MLQLLLLNLNLLSGARQWQAPILAQASRDDDKEGGLKDKGDDASSSALDFEFVFEYFNKMRKGKSWKIFFEILEDSQITR